MAASGENFHVFSINVNGVVVTGTGYSEEAAKDDAMKQISEMVAHTSPASVSSARFCPVDTSQSGISENMVGRLQEYCQAHFWPLPVYTLQNMRGPSHLPYFTMKCTVLGYTADGCGSSKKEAKHNAAKMVYDSIIKYANIYRSKGPEYNNNSAIKRPPASAGKVLALEPSPPKLGTTQCLTTAEKMSVKSVSPKSNAMPLPAVERKMLTWETNLSKLDAAKYSSNSILYVEKTVESELEAVNQKKLSSSKKEPVVNSCEGSDEESIPPGLIILEKDNDPCIIPVEKKPEQDGDMVSKKPIPLPSLEDVLCLNFQKLLTDTEN